jgi:hypothetical protein
MTYEAMAHGARPIADELAGMIRAARASGDYAVVAKLFAPIRLAFADSVNVEVTREMEISETVIDGNEDQTQMAYRCNPTKAAARARLKSLDRNIGKLLEIRQALVSEWGLR